MKLNFKKLLSLALSAVCILSSANVGTVAASKAGSVKQINAFAKENKGTYDPPTTTNLGEPKNLPTMQGSYANESLSLYFGATWDYTKQHPELGKIDAYSEYLTTVKASRIYKGETEVLIKGQGYTLKNDSGFAYLILSSRYFIDIEIGDTATFRFRDGKGRFNDIVTKIKRGGKTSYSIVSSEYVKPSSGNNGGQTEKCTVIYNYKGKKTRESINKGSVINKPANYPDVAYWTDDRDGEEYRGFGTELNRDLSLTAVLKKDIPMESEIWLCTWAAKYPKAVTVFYQYDEKDYKYVEDLKKNNKAQITTNLEFSNMCTFRFGNIDKGKCESKTLKSKIYFPSDIQIQRDVENNVSIKNCQHFKDLHSVQFKDKDDKLTSSTFVFNSITLNAPIRYIKKGNKITNTPELSNGYVWVNEKTGDEIDLADYQIKEDLVLVAKEKREEAEEVANVSDAAICLDKDNNDRLGLYITYSKGYVEQIKGITRTIDDNTEEVDIEDKNLFEKTNTDSIMIKDIFEEGKDVTYILKAAGYQDNKIVVRRVSNNNVEFVRDKSTGMQDLCVVKYMKENKVDGELADNWIYYVPKGKSFEELGVTIETNLPEGYTKWVIYGTTNEFTLKTLINENLIIVPVKENQGADPGQQNPGQQDPGQQNPGQQDPGQQDPGQQNPGQQDPGQQNPGQQNPDNSGQSVPDYTGPVFIEPIIESIDTVSTTNTTSNNNNGNVVISDDETPLSAGMMAEMQGMIDSYKGIRMKDVDAKGYNKLIKDYKKAIKKIKSRKASENEIVTLYKKLQENKKKYVKTDCNIKRIDMSVAKGKNKKPLLSLVKKLDKYIVSKYKEMVFAKLFKKYDNAIKALNNKNISEKKLNTIYNELMTAKKNADKS